MNEKHITVVLPIEKICKNTQRYKDLKERRGNQAVDMVYIQKAVLQAVFGKIPGKVRLTIEEVE